jgi:hypothetical protein
MNSAVPAVLPSRPMIAFSSVLAARFPHDAQRLARGQAK